MVLVSSLFFLSRARLYLSTLAALVYLVFPRFASWQINWLKYQSLKVGWGDVSIEMDCGVQVFNPNHIPARLHNATLDIYRVRPTYISKGHQAPTYGQSFGVVTSLGIVKNE